MWLARWYTNLCGLARIVIYYETMTGGDWFGEVVLAISVGGHYESV